MQPTYLVIQISAHLLSVCKTLLENHNKCSKNPQNLNLLQISLGRDVFPAHLASVALVQTHMPTCKSLSRIGLGKLQGGRDIAGNFSNGKTDALNL